MAYEETERPTRRIIGPGHISERTAALIGTHQTGKAIRLDITGKSLNGQLVTMRQALKPHGYRLHTRRNGDTLTAWASPIHENRS